MPPQDQTPDQTTPMDQATPDQTTPPDQTMPMDETPPMDQTTPMNQAPSTIPAPSMATAPSATAEDPVGGYMPTTPSMSGTAAPGANVIFQPSASPDQAFPPPPPLDEYPICKAGQFDNCRQRGG
jgi:hypothetical protein